ncbi:MAG: glycosyltransferase family 4 protein [Magnetococcales bacterium]|nr:glycosyltransferase family 4 protein [Magnetococcales bacterium]
MWTALAFGLAWWLTGRLCDPDSRLRVLDHPNSRSLHQRPTPRLGGVGAMSGFFVAWAGAWLTSGGLAADGAAALEIPPGVIWLWPALLLLVGVSLLDDWRSLTPKSRFVVHLLAAALPLIGGLSLEHLDLPGISLPLGWGGPLFSLLFLAWMLNLYNFMDGMDGFAGGMGWFGFGFLAAAGWLAGQPFFALTALLVGAANLGFLYWNFPPARIFLGDAGSVPMGFLAGGMILWGDRQGVLPFWAGVLIFAPFVVDATVTFLRRLLRGEKVWEAHRSHAYQRLVRSGWGHRRTTLAEYALMAACGASALGLGRSGSVVWAWGGIVAWGVIFTLLLLWVERRAKV